MTFKFRFSLIGLGIVLFLITTPALVLYARGFKLDWQHRTITKTRAMVIKTNPSKANIFLNNVKQPGTTPDNIRFLTPGDYEVRLEKEGYQPWTKRLSVREQFVTWVNFNRDFITLFLKNPKLQQSLPAGMTSVSKTREEIAFINDGQIGTIDINNGNLTNMGSAAAVKLPALPSNAVVRWEDAESVFQAMRNRTEWGLTASQIAQITEIDTNGAHAAVTLGSDLYSLDKAAPALLEKNVTTFTLNGDSIWYISENFFKRFNYATGNTETIHQATPIASTGRIIRADNQIYLISGTTLFVLNDDFEKIYDNVTSASWDSFAKLLMFATNNEILVYNSTSKKTDLILRSSDPIKNPVLNYATGYVFFENAGKIKAVELDGRDHRNIFIILGQPDALSSFAVSADGRILYIFNNTKINKYTIQQLETGFIQSIVDKLVS